MTFQTTKGLKRPFFLKVRKCSRRFTQKKTQIHTDFKMQDLCTNGKLKTQNLLNFSIN